MESPRDGASANRSGRSRSPRRSNPPDDALKLKKLQKKRKQLSFETSLLVHMIKNMKKTREEEYMLSQDCGVSSVQESYHEVPMPSLGTISTSSGAMSANWTLMPGEVAQAFCFPCESSDEEN